MKKRIQFILLIFFGGIASNSYSQCPATYSTIDEDICGFYILPSGIDSLSMSGAYVDTIPNSMGCDSIITINLTVHPLPWVSFIADVLFGCTPMTVMFTSTTSPNSIQNTWGFGDGTVITNSGGPVGHEYTVGGIWGVTLTSTTSFGCTDSITYTDYIYTEGVNVDLEDTILSCDDTLVISSGTGDPFYNWSTGQISQSIVVDSSGTYEIYVISPLGCVDSSSVYVSFVDCAGIISYETETAVIYPNPTSNSFRLKGLTPNSKITLMDQLGREIYLGYSDIEGDFSSDISLLTAGMYTVLITSDEKRYSAKLMKE